MTAGLVLTTLRLYRAQIVGSAALIALLSSAAVLHGLATASFISDFGAVSCPSPICEARAEQVAQRYLLFAELLPLIGLLPVVIGAFWGAPLLGREFETGTTHFAWTQSVSRRTWLLIRLGVLGLLITIGALVLGAAIEFWLSVFNGFELPGALPSDFSFSHMRATAPVGWWLLAFSLGVASGALLRRTVPAMVVTIVVIVALVIARNILFGMAIAGLTASEALHIRHVETVTLVVVAVVLAFATSWSVERANA